MDTTHGSVTAASEHGYAIIPRVFEPEEMGELALELENSKLPRSKAGIRHAMGTPSVSKVATDPRLLELACEVLGGRAVPYRATLFNKSTSANWLVVWHQDTALPLKNKLNAPGWGRWSVKEGVNYAHAPAAA